MYRVLCCLLLAASALASPLFLWSVQKDMFASAGEHHEPILADHVNSALSLLLGRSSGGAIVADATQRKSVVVFLEDHMNVAHLLHHELLLNDVKGLFNAAASSALYAYADTSAVLATAGKAAARLVCLDKEGAFCQEARATLQMDPVEIESLVEDGTVTIVCLEGRDHSAHGRLLKAIAAKLPEMTALFAGHTTSVPHPHPHHHHRPAASNEASAPAANGQTTTGHYFTPSNLQGVLFMLLFVGALFGFLYMTLGLQTPATFEGDPTPGSKQR